MQMKSSPAYHALSQKKEKTHFTFDAKHKKDLQGNQYFLIELQKTKQALSIADVLYQEEGSPHLSYYQYYKKSKDELSVFHYTWYGVNDNTHIVLHLYFDVFGRYLNYQCKNKETKKNINNMSEIEEKNFRLLFKRSALLVTQPVLQYVCQQQVEAQMNSDLLLKELEELSPFIKKQPQKYINKAKECINTIQTQNRWRYTAPNQQGAFLQRLVNQLEQKNNAVTPLLSTGTFKYNNLDKQTVKVKESNHVSPVSSTDTKHRSSETLNTKKSEISNKIKLKLEEINNKINSINTSDECQAAHDTFFLIKSKHDMLLNCEAELSSDVWLHSFQAMNQQQQKIEELFEKEIKEEKPSESLHLLIPYLSGINFVTLQYIIYSGDVQLFRLYMQYHQSSALFLFNYAAFSNEMNLSKSEKFKSAVTFHQLILFSKKSSVAFLEAALEYGLDPNFDTEIHESILYQAIASGYFDHAKCLLSFGANPNPLVGKKHHALAQCHDSNLFQVKHQLIKRTIRNDFDVSSNNEGIPLQMAIVQNNLEIVELLLQKGASLTFKDNKGFNAMGWATCQVNNPPSLEIVKKLIEYGADINAVQCQCSMLQDTTPLIFACQRGDNKEFLQGLIELGANPNQLIDIQFKVTSSVSYAAYMTPLFKLVSKHLEGRKNLDCIEYVLKQNTNPVSLLNAVFTLANIIIFDQYKRLNIIRIKENNEIGFVVGITPSTKKNHDIIHMLYQYINELEHVRIEQGLAIVTQAENLYKNKEYFRALPFWISGIILFGNCENQNRLQSCLFNTACCLFALKEYPTASSFYKITSDFVPCTKTNELAKMMLKKIEEKLQQKSLPQSMSGFGC